MNRDRSISPLMAVLEFIFGMIFLGAVTYGTIMAGYVLGG